MTFGKWGWLPIVLLAQVLAACGSLEQNVAAGVLGATAAGGQSPSHEIQQTYYLGVFDPQEQLPPQMYRVRVHGQASFISQTSFASGWVPAPLVDSLGSGIKLDQAQGRVDITKAEESVSAALKPGRRLIMFGPEGFREAPANHRLVVVMGSDPEEFFNAVDDTLGTVADVIDEQRAGGLTQELFAALSRVQAERARLSDLKADVAGDRLRLAEEAN